MIDLNFVVPNIDLARLVFEVAEDCYYEKSNQCYRIRHHMDIDVEGMVLKLFKAFYSENPDILKKIEKTYALKKEEREIEKERIERIKEKICEYIGEDIQLGWELAYQLSDGIDTEEGKKLRYDLMERLQELSTDTKIDICDQYISSLKDEYYFNGDAYLKKAGILLSDLGNNNSDVLSGDNRLNEACLCLQQFYNTGSDKLSSIEKIIGFCKKIELTEELLKWQNAYIECYLSLEETKCNTHDLLDALLATKQMNLIDQVVSKMVIKDITPEVVYAIIDEKKYKLAETILDKLYDYEIHDKHNKGNNGHRMAWIDSIRYRIPFYRKGYAFYSRWDCIHFYDYIYIVDQELSEDVLRIKNKYKNDFYIHRCCLAELELYKVMDKENREKHGDFFAEACEKDIVVIPQIIEFIREFRAFLNENHITKEQIYNTSSIVEEDEFKLANCKVFFELAKYYAKKDRLYDALRICDIALELGYTDDGTKSGMQGRRERILKKIDKTKSQVITDMSYT